MVKHFYGYVFGDLVNLVDVFGFSSEDVQRIINRFNEIVEYMNKHKLRRPGSGEFNGWVNNFVNFWTGEYLGCIDQAYFLSESLKDLELDDQLTFKSDRVNPFHSNVLAIPNNENDPTLRLDTWKNEYHKEK